MKKSKNINLGSWIVRTLQDNHSAPERKAALVALELKKYNIDIAALSESRLAGSSQLEESKRRKLRHSGDGFAIKAEIARSLLSLSKGISDCILTLTLELDHNTRATLVSCYAPTMVSTEQEKDDFYDQLRDVIFSYHHRDKLILMGDFNARVGTDFRRGMVYLVAMV
ncbi:craniofacial development protein 2-like [Octopus bimaculoides]|uniref:craniofacial development protein 2-like n=1 Tax=Octopus bimaculoides TaxID=37653 RepID=UPI00071C5A1E|nr:craniofacial development protein 2-like [Octopus bimaculoides]|eukprot:XP_014779877.1 PREDICTED: craniofacial development protein 2-like [Octopus bimaculoides]